MTPFPDASLRSDAIAEVIPDVAADVTAKAGPPAEPWWHTAVTYQVYVRSFADGNGDGVGDLRGIRDRLEYLASLGVDAVWLNPCFPSPMADAGYDIANYRDIEPAFGTLAEMDALIAEAHQRGMKILLDIVPNHCSDRHPRLQEAGVAGAGAGLPARR